MTRVIRLRTSLLIGLLAFGAASLGWSQSRRPIVSSVDVQVPSPPIPVNIAGKPMRMRIEELEAERVHSGAGVD